jgi:hypothetical protein
MKNAWIIRLQTIFENNPPIQCGASHSHRMQDNERFVTGSPVIDQGQELKGP